MVSHILQYYHVFPTNVERVTDSVYKIGTHTKSYALKKSKLTKNKLSMFQHVYHRANAQQITPIVPIYLTKNNKIYCEVNNGIYYLTPWIETIDEKQSIGQFYRSLGQLHTKTKQTEMIEVTPIMKQFKKYQHDCKSLFEKMLYFMEMFEANRYMSPFELLVCTQYHLVETAFFTMKKCIGIFVEELQQDSSWNNCLCHGNIELEHIIFARTTYLINWEKAYYANPIKDLIQYFQACTIHFDMPMDGMLQHFSNYLAENKLSKKELYLITIYLLDIKTYCNSIDSYVLQKRKRRMIEQITQLQRLHRRLIFGLKWFDLLEEKYNDLDKEEN